MTAGFVNKNGYTREEALESVGPGWASLVNEAFDFLLKNYPETKIIQVKEKFAGLRIYFRSPDEDLDPIDYKLDSIMARSRTVCEQCGEPGKPTTRGWIQTLCEKHREELGK